MDHLETVPMDAFRLKMLCRLFEREDTATDLIDSLEEQRTPRSEGYQNVYLTPEEMEELEGALRRLVIKYRGEDDTVKEVAGGVAKSDSQEEVLASALEDFLRSQLSLVEE